MTPQLEQDQSDCTLLFTFLLQLSVAIVVYLSGDGILQG